MRKLLLLSLFTSAILYAANQTGTTSPILSPDSLPFEISISLADFQLPSDDLNAVGLQSFACASYHGKWLLLSGRTSGLHGFGDPVTSFPINKQNTTVYVVDPNKKTVISRSLNRSALTQSQIDSLSATAAEFHQVRDTLYLVGGYSGNTLSGTYSTQSILTAIDIPGMIRWVEGTGSAVESIRQTSHPFLQVTGGFLSQADPHSPFLLVFGQNYKGYYVGSVSGIYTQQVRPFRIVDNGTDLYIQPEKTDAPNANYRRRDLNVVPIVQKIGTSYQPSYIALSGVFTATGGAWTVPVFIDANGSSFMPNPNASTTFKQGMNNYYSAYASLFSKNSNDTYILVFGGISYLYDAGGGDIEPDPELPFINSVTTIKMDSQGNFAQYLMDNQFPTIPADFTNIGNTLLFGAEAEFIQAENVPTLSNEVLSFDDLGSGPIVLGYIVGGIQSTLGNTSGPADSAASPYIFKVSLQKR